MVPQCWHCCQWSGLGYHLTDEGMYWPSGRGEPSGIVRRWTKAVAVWFPSLRSQAVHGPEQAAVRWDCPPEVAPLGGKGDFTRSLA